MVVCVVYGFDFAVCFDVYLCFVVDLFAIVVFLLFVI